MKNTLISIGTFTLLSLGSASALASDLTVPNEFVSGTPAVAADVNANFDAIEAAVDDNDTRITTNTADIATNTADIADKADAADVTANSAAIATKADQSDVDANTANILSNTTNIGANATAIGTNASAIGAKADQTDVDTNTAAIANKADQTDVDANTAAIANKADQTDVDTNTAAIANKADQTDVDTNTANINGNTIDIADLLAGKNGVTCEGNDSNDIMVRVGPLCVDKYEASVWTTSDGSASGAQYGDGGDNYPCADTGNDCTAGTTIYARSEEGINPSANISWFQAQQACAASGKRLLTNAEWQMAAAGTPDPGSAGSDTANECNTNSSGIVATGTSAGGTNECVSNYGAFDMVGNVHEWVADWIQGADVDANGQSNNDGNGAGASYGDDTMGGTTPANNQGTGATNMPAAVIRGGRWAAGGSGIQAGVFAFSARYAPSVSDPDIGFRCAR